MSSDDHGNKIIDLSEESTENPTPARSSAESGPDVDGNDDHKNKKQSLTSKVWDHFERVITGK